MRLFSHTILKRKMAATRKKRNSNSLTVKDSPPSSPLSGSKSATQTLAPATDGDTSAPTSPSGHSKSFSISPRNIRRKLGYASSSPFSDSASKKPSSRYSVDVRSKPSSSFSFSSRNQVSSSIIVITLQPCKCRLTFGAWCFENLVKMTFYTRKHSISY